MTKNDLPIYELVFDDTDDTLGCTKISLVESPAVEQLFLAFNENTKIKSVFHDETKHTVTGIAMRADYPIYRNQNSEEFYVMFSKETIEKMMNKFMKEQRQFDISLEHSKDVNNCYLVESFLINKERGIVPKEFADIEDGSWVITVKVDNPDVWNDIINNEVKGFSIETQMIANTFSKQEHHAKELGITMEELSKLFSIFK